MTLSKQQREKLWKTLMDAFPTKSSLEQLLLFKLDRNLDAIAGGNNLQDIVFNLIKTAEAQGWIDELIKSAKEFNPDNPLLIAITQELSISKSYILDSYYLHPLRDNLDELKIIFQEVDDNYAIKAAYQSTLSGKEMPTKNQIIDELVLSDSGKSDSLYIVKFVKYLVKNLEENKSDKSDKVRYWLKKTSIELNLDFYIDIPISESTKKEIEIYLFIKVDDEGNQLRLQAEVMKQGQKSEPLDLPGNDVKKGITCTFEKIPEKINEYIIYYDYLQNSIQTNITVELLLPMQYIDKNIFYDWWKKFSNTRIGVLILNNKIRIHLRERIGKAYYPALKANWDKCKVNSKSNLNQVDFPKLEIVKIEDKVNLKNRERIAYQLKGKVGVKFSYNHQVKQREHFQAVLIAGTPLVFWTKCSHLSFDNMDCELKLKPDCFDNNFHEVIDLIQDFIMKANNETKPKEHFGHHLGFLCDYPCDILESWSLRE